MSLSRKFTWNDFLKDHPDFKQKKVKRTSAEGKKAFDSASKAFVKEYLVKRSEKIAREIARATKRRDERVGKLRELRKAKKNPKAKLAQLKVGRSDAAIANLKKQQEKTKAAQKDF